jgi:hypothetical protein
MLSPTSEKEELKDKNTVTLTCMLSFYRKHSEISKITWRYMYRPKRLIIKHKLYTLAERLVYN